MEWTGETDAELDYAWDEQEAAEDEYGGDADDDACLCGSPDCDICEETTDSADTDGQWE